MARLTIYKDDYVDSTVVPNRFIDEYMKEANDAQLKVYLYLIRMVNANQATSVSDIADKFNHTEKDVLRALRYWEKRALLSLDYDEDKSLVGVHLCDLTASAGADGRESRTDGKAAASTVKKVSSGMPSAPSPAETVSAPAAVSLLETVAGPADDSPAGYGALPAAPSPAGNASLRTNPSLTETGALPTASSPAGNASGRMPAAELGSSVLPPEEPAFTKPVYSADQLREFKSREETAQLLFIAESYIGRPLTPGEMKSILFFTDGLRFSDDLIDYLLQYCVDRGKKDFKYIEKVALHWAEEGIATSKQAQRYSTKYDKNVYAIMNELGKNGSPTTKELEYITRWTKDYGFSTDIIFEACERTVMATDKHRFEYAESILSSWKQADVHRKTDIRRIDDLYQQKRKSTSTPKTAAGNKFNQFTQNSYDFDELEKELEQELLRG